MALKHVFCPQKGKQMPANLALKDNSLRCCGCGNVHTETKAFFQADLTPMKSGKKKFKKGGKSKKKKGGQEKAPKS